MHPPRFLTVARSLALLGATVAAPSVAHADPPATSAPARPTVARCPARRSEASGACRDAPRSCVYDRAGALLHREARRGELVCWCDGRSMEGDPVRWRCYRNQGVVRGPLLPPEFAA